MAIDYLARIEKAIDFIEENLLEPITLKEVAGEAGFSQYHFHRIFQSILGSSVTLEIGD